MLEKLKRGRVLALILTISLAPSLANSKNGDDVNTAILLLMLQDRGNCAVISRSDIDGDDLYQYTASGRMIPNGGCKSAALAGTFTLSSDDALTAQKADYAAAIGELSAPQCSTAKSTVETLHSNATAAAIESTADAASPKCVVVGNLGGNTTYCSSQEELVKHQANTIYLPVTSVLTDMAAALAYKQAVEKVSAKQALSEFSTAAIEAMTPDSVDTVSIKTSAGYLGYSYAVYEGALAKECRKTILDRSADLRAMIERAVGTDTTMGTSGSGVASVLHSISCGYGDDWVEPTRNVDGTEMVSRGTCPASYPQF